MYLFPLPGYFLSSWTKDDSLGGALLLSKTERVNVKITANDYMAFTMDHDCPMLSTHNNIFNLHSNQPGRFFYYIDVTKEETEKLSFCPSLCS